LAKAPPPPRTGNRIAQLGHGCIHLPGQGTKGSAKIAGGWLADAHDPGPLLPLICWEPPGIKRRRRPTGGTLRDTHLRGGLEEAIKWFELCPGGRNGPALRDGKMSKKNGVAGEGFRCFMGHQRPAELFGPEGRLLGAF